MDQANWGYVGWRDDREEDAGDEGEPEEDFEPSLGFTEQNETGLRQARVTHSSDLEGPAYHENPEQGDLRQAHYLNSHPGTRHWFERDY